VFTAGCEARRQRRWQQLTTANRMASLRSRAQFRRTDRSPQAGGLPCRGVDDRDRCFAAGLSSHLAGTSALPQRRRAGSTRFYRPRWQPDSTSPDVTFAFCLSSPAQSSSRAVALLNLHAISGVLPFPVRGGAALAQSHRQTSPRDLRRHPEASSGAGCGIHDPGPLLSDTFTTDLAPVLPVVRLEVFRAPGFLQRVLLAGRPPSSCQSWSCHADHERSRSNAFRASQELRTGSLALGTTALGRRIRHILIPAALPGVHTAVVLGMTRAAGEALAVQMVIRQTPP